jgi:uncharacterized membrane protein
MHFSPSGFFEGLGALFALMALSSGRVVVVSPIVATTPLWNLLIAVLFLRGRKTSTLEPLPVRSRSF